MIQKIISFNKTETFQNVNTIIFFTQWLNMKFRHGNKRLSRMETRGKLRFYGVRDYKVWKSFIKNKKLLI